MVNSNPETVSTDFDTSSRLYFEPLDEESVRDILENEAVLGDDNEVEFPASIVQFGGQTAINLSQSLDRAAMPILGSTARSIDVASDRQLFEEFLHRVDIPNPPGTTVGNVEQALNAAEEVGYPILVPAKLRAGRARHGDSPERIRACPIHGRRVRSGRRPARADRQVFRGPRG